MSSYDQPEEFVSMEQFHETMRLVRLQIALPVSGAYGVAAWGLCCLGNFCDADTCCLTVLIALGTSIICTVGLKPNIGA